MITQLTFSRALVVWAVTLHWTGARAVAHLVILRVWPRRLLLVRRVVPRVLLIPRLRIELRLFGRLVRVPVLVTFVSIGVVRVTRVGVRLITRHYCELNYYNNYRGCGSD